MSRVSLELTVMTEVGGNLAVQMVGDTIYAHQRDETAVILNQSNDQSDESPGSLILLQLRL